MFLNRTTKYALRVLMEMAEDVDKTYSTHYLYKKHDIPEKYLAQLLTNLSKYGFTKSNRGRTGGFRFKMKPENIYLSAVVNSMESLSKFQFYFFGIEECSKYHANTCAMRSPWQDAWQGIYKTLTKTTIRELVQNDSIIEIDRL